MKILIRRIKFVLIGILSIISIFLVLSRDATPLSPAIFQTKRLQEKIFIRFKPNPKSKLEYYAYLLNERLDELKAVAETSDSSYTLILMTSLRYSTTAGQMTDFIKNNHLTDQTPGVLKLFQDHQQIISVLVESYPKDFGDEWKFLEDDINYLQIYSRDLQSLQKQP